MILYLFCNNVWLDVVSASKFNKNGVSLSNLIFSSIRRQIATILHVLQPILSYKNGVSLLAVDTITIN